MGGPQGRSARVRKISPITGLDPRNIQPVASRYTDWGIPARTSAVRGVMPSMHLGDYRCKGKARGFEFSDTGSLNENKPLWSIGLCVLEDGR